MTSTSNSADAPSFGYAFAETLVGTAVVAIGDAGVAAVLLGSDETRLLRLLREALPEGASIHASEDAKVAAAAVAAAVARPSEVFVTPVDLRGSPLELAVWEALRKVPTGTTTTYGALARSLPLPATAQEVGAACAANRVAVAVPCHRVLKADGSISGYRWGVARKRRLLELEAAA